MTTITILKSGSAYKGFYCMGHAGSKRFFFEKDMICASISVLVINTINAIDILTSDKVKITSNEQNGFIKCDFPDALSEQGKLLVDAMILGLQSIEKQYGKRYLLVKFEEV